ncbi:MAG: ankyrin repeat and protein mask-like isoform [Rickettsiaceae bacterium]|jgi:ankyrin repeat protein|nr:ankyrin repeat and protein mask-like isoform [Rickettsiaceae bacterium]
MKTKIEIIYTVESTDPIASELISSIKEHDLDKFKAIVDGNPELLRKGNIFIVNVEYIVYVKHFKHNCKFKASHEHLLAIYAFSEGISYIVNNIKYADWNCSAENSYTPLTLAAENGHTDTTKILIAAGADVNHVNKKGKTPLMWAANMGHTETVEKLFDLGADVNKTNKYGETPLMWAASMDHTETVKKLLDMGAEVNQANKKGKTPLIVAVRNDYSEIAKLLIAAGADRLTNKDNIKQPILKMLAQDILKMLEAQEYIDDLLEGKQPAAIELDATEEEMVLARVENKLSKLLVSGKIVQNISSIKPALEGCEKNHPIAAKVLVKLEEFIEYKVLESDVKAARSLGLSFTESLKDIIVFTSFQGDGTRELSEKLLKAYDAHKDEPSVIERLNRLKASFESYLSYKKFYLAEHPEYTVSEIPDEILPKLNLLFSNLLQLEGVNEYQSEFDKAPLLEEAILFYCFYPEHQLPGNLTDITQCENSFNLP